MAKKWSEVISSPDYQALSAPEKADAQAQYFNQVVKPKLSESEVDAAHEQFYKQYPVGATGATTAASSTTPNPTTQPQPSAPQGATQEPTEGEDKSSLTYALHHPGEAFSALGNDLALGAAHWLTTDHSTGQETAPQGAAHDWYVQNMADPETRKNALASEEALKMGGQIAAYTSGAGAVEALGMAGLKGFVASNVAGSLASQAVGDQGFSVGQTAEDVATAGLLHGAAKVVGSTVSGLRNVLPESLGGYSTAEKAADVANPDYVEKVLQNGDNTAQDIYRTATTDANGNSILNPSQTFNTGKGAKYIAAEQRDLTRGDKSLYSQNLAAQKSGDSVSNAVNDISTNPEGLSVQEAAQKLADAHKERVNRLYQTSKNNAQAVLDNAPVKITNLKFPDTRQIAIDQLDKSTASGNVLLNAETRRTLTNFNKAKITDLDTLDQWKRTLSEKAQKAFRNGDHTSYQALNQVKNSLRNEADDVIHSIDPTAGSLYADADKYFAGTVEGYGKKSELQKLVNSEFGQTAENRLFNPSVGEQRTQRLFASLDNSQKGTTFDAATQATNDLASAIGTASRARALEYATRGEHFSPTKFYNKLDEYAIQNLEAHNHSPLNQFAYNSALQDVASTLKTSNANSVSRGLTPTMANVTGRVIGGGAGTLAGGGVLGGLVGQEVGGRAADLISGGLIDRIMGTNKNAQKYINFLSDPANAQKVSDILANRGGLNASTKDITSAIDALTGAQSGYHSLNAPTTQPTYNPAAMPLQNEPEQHTQSARSVSNDSDSFDPRVTKLYKALASAETGGLDNRFIRTKAAEAGVSTAYGAAQLTTNTMKDFYKRHPEQFNSQERDYIKRFIDQGEKMKRAPKNDPVFGYGGSGVLGGKEDRKLYARVARKMLAQMIKDNGGSLDKTVRQWRGADDHAYFAKVRSAFRAA